MDLMESEKITYNTAEKIILGTTHAEVGGYLLGLWGLPEKIIEVTLYHHNNEKIKCEKIDTLSATFLANIFSYQSNHNENSTDFNCSESIISSIKEICSII